MQASSRHRLPPAAQYEHGVPGELKREEWQYGQRVEARKPDGKGCASWCAVLVPLGTAVLGFMGLTGLTEILYLNVDGVGCVPVEDKGVTGFNIFIFGVDGVKRIRSRDFRRT